MRITRTTSYICWPVVNIRMWIKDYLKLNKTDNSSVLSTVQLISLFIFGLIGVCGGGGGGGGSKGGGGRYGGDEEEELGGVKLGEGQGDGIGGVGDGIGGIRVNDGVGEEEAEKEDGEGGATGGGKWKRAWIRGKR